LGDFLLLREYIPEHGYTGDEFLVYVPYIVWGGMFGIPEDYCIMSVVPAAKYGRE
jgi:hypothetical protein